MGEFKEGMTFEQAAEAMGHKLRRNEDGEVDIFICDSGFHNGPGCEICGDDWCHHCTEPSAIEKCDGGERKRVHEAEQRVRAAAPDLLEALKGLVALECPITVKDPFGQAVTAHWTEQQAQGHGYAHLYLKALAALSRATGSEAK